MSLKYRDSQGNETPVAGLNGTSGELVPSVSLYQSGALDIPLNASGVGEQQITFTTPMPDTDYVINIVFDNSQTCSFRIVSKTANGFLIRIGDFYDIEFSTTVTGTWTVFKLMTDESRALDEAAIAQNTANFAPSFSTLTSYAVGDYVTYSGMLYRCTTAHTAGVWVAGHFTQVTVGEQLKVQDISSSITMGDGYDSGQIYVFRDGNTVQVLFNSVVTTGYSKTICSGLPKPLHSGYFCVQADADPQELGLALLRVEGTIDSGTNMAGMAPNKIWDGFITYLTRD